jgi:hypothetical protein
MPKDTSQKKRVRSADNPATARNRRTNSQLRRHNQQAQKQDARQAALLSSFLIAPPPTEPLPEPVPLLQPQQPQEEVPEHQENTVPVRTVIYEDDDFEEVVDIDDLDGDDPDDVEEEDCAPQNSVMDMYLRAIQDQLVIEKKIHIMDSAGCGTF